MQLFDSNPDYHLKEGGGTSDHSSGEKLSRELNSELNVSSITNRVDVNMSKKQFAGDAYINWARDSKGNFVTKSRWGRLLTRDDRGRMVDYQHHIENKRMQSRDQMAFTSILFCNPLMLMGLGATFAFMDHFNQSGAKNEYNRLKNKLDGKGKAKQSKGYESKDVLKALTLTTAIRQSSLDANSTMSFEEEMKQKARRRQLDLNQRRRITSRRRFDEPGALSRNNLIKMKERLTETLERMRGNADLADVSKIESQIEKLDRALTRLSYLSS